ncbi:hypothetical protein LDO26_01070 [Luteimonas sp. BDR2-5]|uniref:DUF5983 family protein n=1 Tax=Proluteimonas luteida TaxID=2878685 RepID=UPI001E3B9944|nr:hypothetical protein [Luteimonas sp. BDR2-5]MCD9026807.1 hypothetical protein [Luteimonas sp. BDR2-5]
MHTFAVLRPVHHRITTPLVPIEDAAGVRSPHALRKEAIPMRDVPPENLSQFGELLAAISLRHLCPDTRRKLLQNALSVHAYPHDTGGLVYVGSPGYAVPAEPDLAKVFALAVRAKIVWLMFDPDAGIVDGLPLFGDDGGEQTI